MNSRSNKDSGEAKAKGGVSGKRVARLFVTYWAIAFMVVVLSFYAIADLVTLKLAYILFAATIVVAAVATLIHIRNGKKDGVDELVKRMPD
jgi:hypothetical protein